MSDAQPASANRGVYVTLEELQAFRYKARGFSFLPRQPVHSIISGRHASRVRGRGLNFEELRNYMPGDDVRTIDWKVTARLRAPHVRVFTEERDRPAILIVDQRVSMFYGSQRAMKSVVAAEAAAIGAWRVTGVGDRVGAIVFGDEDFDEIRPHRSTRTVHRILSSVVARNNALHVTEGSATNPTMLNVVLDRVAQTAKHDHLVTILSDFDGADDRTTQIITKLSQHNDVLAVPITDPTSVHIPAVGRVVASDGDLQVELDFGSTATRKRLLDYSDKRLAKVLAWQSDLGFPVLPLTTAEETLSQIQRLLGQKRRTATSQTQRGGS